MGLVFKSLAHTLKLDMRAYVYNPRTERQWQADLWSLLASSLVELMISMFSKRPGPKEKGRTNTEKGS